MGAAAAALGHTQLQSMGSIAATARVRAPTYPVNVRVSRDRHPAGRVGLDARLPLGHPRAPIYARAGLTAPLSGGRCYPSVVS